MLTKQQIKTIAESMGYEYAEIKAFLVVETSGQAYDKFGNLYIQFEPHLFSDWLDRFGIEHSYHKRIDGKYFIECKGIQLTNGVEVQSKELAAYALACKIDERAAMLSTSWGLGQILGQNFKLAGYDNAREMITDFQESEESQVRAICTFLDKTGIKKFIQSEDWKSVAQRYNGKEYWKNQYDVKLKAAYEAAKK